MSCHRPSEKQRSSEGAEVLVTTGQLSWPVPSLYWETASLLSVVKDNFTHEFFLVFGWFYLLYVMFYFLWGLSLGSLNLFLNIYPICSGALKQTNKKPLHLDPSGLIKLFNYILTLDIYGGSDQGVPPRCWQILRTQSPLQIGSEFAVFAQNPLFTFACRLSSSPVVQCKPK